MFNDSTDLTTPSGRRWPRRGLSAGAAMFSTRSFDGLGDDSADDLVAPSVLGCWSPTLVRRVAKLLLTWDAAGDPRGEVLAAAAHAQAEQFGPVFAQAVLPALVEHCPPALVEAMGATQTRSVIGPLLEAVPFDEARPSVQVALACAMGELGGSVARAHLTDWDRRPDLKRSVRHEIRFALTHLS